MSRSISEIYNAIIAEKETFTELNQLTPIPETTQTLLSDLKTTSKVGIWRLWAFVIAVAIYAHEEIFDAHTEEVEELILNKTFGQLKWYELTSKAFQYGYDLAWSDINYRYEYSDTTSQEALDSMIITQAAATTIDTTVGYEIILKVAKGTVGSLSALSTAEKTAFDYYVDRIKPAGTNISTVNAAADDMKISITITYDPLLISVDGSTPERAYLISDSAVYPAEEAVVDYIQQIDFDSYFKVIDLVDALQAVDGVLNVTVQKASARYGALEYTDIMIDSEQKYNANAGYLAMATGHDVNEYFPETYDTGLTYKATDWVLYAGDYYEANRDGITGAWNASYWDILTTADVATIKYIEG